MSDCESVIYLLDETLQPRRDQLLIGGRGLCRGCGVCGEVRGLE